MQTLKVFSIFFSLQFISYLNLTIALRAIAHDQLAIAVLTEALAPLLAWTMITHVSNAKESLVGKVAVMSGGVAATVVGMWWTSQWSA